MKRTALAVLLFVAAPAFGAQPVQVCDGTRCLDLGADGALAVKSVPANATAFTCGVVGQAASLLECAALAAGRRYVITSVIAGSNTSTATSFAIQSGTGTNCGTATTQVFPPPPMTTSARYVGPANTAPPSFYPLSPGLVVTTAHAVCVIGLGTNTANVMISGYYYTP